MAEFHVVIEGLDLDEASTKAINESIQRVVLDHLAGHDITAGRNPRAVIAFRPHPGWYGLVAQAVAQKDLGQVAAVERLRERLQ